MHHFMRVCLIIALAIMQCAALRNTPARFSANRAYRNYASTRGTHERPFQIHPMKFDQLYSSQRIYQVPAGDAFADRLQQPRWGGRILGPILRYLNSFVVGMLFTYILRIRNRFRVTRRQQLLDLVFCRPKERGLLTVSNHQSMLDDPGLWSALLPFWRMRPEQVRYSLCTEDIFFAVSFKLKTMCICLLSNAELISFAAIHTSEQILDGDSRWW